MRFCPQCGEPIEEGLRFCVNCGISLADVELTARYAEERASSSEPQPVAHAQPAPEVEPVAQPFVQPQPAPAAQPQPEPQPFVQPQPQSAPASEPTMVSPPIGSVPSPNVPQAKKSSKVVVVALVCAVAVIGVATGAFLSPLLGAGTAPSDSQQQAATAPRVEESQSQGEKQDGSQGQGQGQGQGQDQGLKKTDATSTVEPAVPPSSNTTGSKEIEVPTIDPTPPTNQQTAQAPEEFVPYDQRTVTLTASSELPGDEVTSYYGPNNVTDNNYTTAWNEGAEGHGIGEWISLNMNWTAEIKGVSIVNGYPKTQDIYYKNNRCRNVTVQLSDGYEQHVTLKDAYRKGQEIAFDRVHKTTFVRIRIDSVYEGTTWDDTSICEIMPF